ncbi:phosphoribosylaminoimidazolesuccinocarboxamide synthase [Nitrococcus mobilis]|uniref:Phosphoribosylaminoimidazole-succinocarboxamide synthase n=1 Tax=Nitrococcus mobilis Nb-231 TaxID=314278 RepID=A4BSD1_9GAMM|nr:phosphoribosylaminoimidazolesuccinocarboxamide synthase [Nitrococcus mobilis]EAR21391.1 phosphoribosylaminoimidazole-succinocarboxamide synthase [Nitrococcus mobilis Nb-231]
MATVPETLFKSQLTDLRLVQRGKVRDIYEIDDARLLIVTTDRLSAFDVILPDPIPGKGIILTALSRFWFERTRPIIGNHLLADPLESVLTRASEVRQVQSRAMVVRRLQPLPIEAVARGYLVGSAWNEYRRSGQVCGIPLPPGLQQADQLPEPIFTPATKATAGSHDQNIDFAQTVQILGHDTAEQVRRMTLKIYNEATSYARRCGIIIADTKFEFARDHDGQLLLIDEILTPDSSRFWPADQYRSGSSPPSFDKQFVRDYLASLAWDQTTPGPRLPAKIIAQTAEKYREAQRRLVEAD